MILISPDHDRHIKIPGVAAPVSRPVDIDQAITGFRHLRTLRIYRFDQQTTIEGHAEEDEVFIVVLAGTIQLTLSGDAAVTLSAASAAYLPPGGAYTLVAVTDTDVAYARATPTGTRPVRVFSSRAEVVAPGVTVLLEETAHAERLRLRLLQCEGADVGFAPAGGGEERLLHVRMSGVLLQELTLHSWDTAALSPDEDPTLILPRGSSGLMLIVSAR